jgi:hypothetical protein
MHNNSQHYNPPGRNKRVLSVLFTCLLIAHISASFVSSQVRAPIDAERDFVLTVLPVLKSACFNCHGDRIAFSDLNMTSRDLLMTGGLYGPAIQPGNADSSLLIQVVEHTHESLIMPPMEKDSLSTDIILKLRNWIDAGAPWSEEGAATIQAEQDKSWSPEYTDEALWAFRPVPRVSVPEAGVVPEACHTPVDNFLQASLQSASLEPAPPADRPALIRRVTFNLTGLPPTAEEIDTFVEDTSADAFATVIERLLASPAYGEHWGRHWLDVVRYANTGGFSNDWERPNAWRYRDYVIRSFNEDKPYDRFIVEQLAGDELDPLNPENLIATGFLRMGPWEHTGMVVEAISRQLFLDDVTQSTVTTFLGLTARCASCHDHKFDPIPTRDYYRMQAVFAPVRFEEQQVPFLPSENRNAFDTGSDRAKSYITLNKQRNKALTRQVHERLMRQHQVDNIKELPVELVRDSVLQAVGEEQRAYTKRVEYYERELNRYQPLAYAVSSGGLSKPLPTPDTHILIGGSLQSPGDKVSPGVFSAPDGSNDATRTAAWNSVPETTHGRRLALANWIASPSNTLTARVMVNRIWQYHFGTGLVKTSNNLGKLGGIPTHPELLDWLAQYFIEHRWSIKSMHRLILNSAVWQRSSTPPNPAAVAVADPSNRLLSYFPARRLTAEEMRDAILMASGQLNREMGGPGVFPEINNELALQPRQIMGTIAPMYEPSATPNQRNRRSIYTFQRRSLVNPMVEVFNGPDLNTSCERREATTVTPQVFSLFNSQFSHDAALSMAQHLGTQTQEIRAQIKLAFHTLFGRPADDAEVARCIQHFDLMREYHTNYPPTVPEPPQKVVRSIIGELSGRKIDFKEEWDPAGYTANLQPIDVAPETRALAELCLVLLNSNELAFIY